MKIENKQVLGRVECLGSTRNSFEKELNQQYGEGNWGYGWLVDVTNPETNQVETLLLEKEQIIEEYLQAYLLLAQNVPWIFHRLVEAAAEVFEVDPETDVESGTDFSIQNSRSTHYMDIAVRVVLQMYNLEFKGQRKIHINDGGDSLPVDLVDNEEINGKTWFDVFNPSQLVVSENLAPAKALEKLQILTDPCAEAWAERPEEGKPLTAESLYQFTRVVWAIGD